ncbi:tetratricopeptide repeat protein [Salinicola tamaricis]|uniref:tetratricopeptide repeat protein n=1 Tax=Salinicola tamaricis TaxID=1771309 RepID=UPI000D0A7A66|nr:hypothetical protein [Salinicola tamaricis]
MDAPQIVIPSADAARTVNAVSDIADCRCVGAARGQRRRYGAALLLLALLAATPALAEGPALRSSMIASLESLQQQLAAGDNAAVASRAEAAAARLDGGNAADRWARALFLQLEASALARQGDSAAAAARLATARGIAEVPAARRLAWLRQEAQLRLAAGQRERGADLLTRWVEASGGDAESRWLLVRTRAALSEWQAAADSLDRLHASGSASWDADQRQLASTVYQHSGRFDDALALLGDDADSPQVWRRAAGLAQQAGDSGRAAAIWESGWRRGVLTRPQDLVQLAELHIAGGTPARAGEYLARWLADGELPRSEANLRLEAQAWSAAREHDKALAAWRALATLTGSAADWRQLAETAYGWGEWQVVLDALSQIVPADDVDRNKVDQNAAQKTGSGDSSGRLPKARLAADGRCAARWSGRNWHAGR